MLRSSLLSMVIRLVPNNILRQGYIYAYLASKPGYSLLTQGTFGAVIQHIEPAFVASLPIPVLPEAFQQEVDNLIQESARLREEATDALDKAHALLHSAFNNKDANLKSVSIRKIYAAHNKDLKRLITLVIIEAFMTLLSNSLSSCVSRICAQEFLDLVSLRDNMSQKAE